MKAVRWHGLEASSLGKALTFPRCLEARFLGRKASDPWRGASNFRWDIVGMGGDAVDGWRWVRGGGVIGGGLDVDRGWGSRELVVVATAGGNAFHVYNTWIGIPRCKEMVFDLGFLYVFQKMDEIDHDPIYGILE